MNAIDAASDSISVPPSMLGRDLAALFEANSRLQIVAVVENERPIGIVTRDSLFSTFSQTFGRDLWGRRPISALMNASPRTIDADQPIENLGIFIAESAPDALREGVLFVDGAGRYVGAASGLDLYVSAVRISSFRNRQLHDLNERLVAEKRETERANSASRAKSEFLATVSHEIRTPLNGILGVAQALALDMTDKRQRESLDLIRSSGETLLRLLNDILDLSKIEAGRMEIAPTDADLFQLLRRVRDIFEPLALEKGIRLHLSVPETHSGWMRFDPLRVQQCLANLISNAVKFTERGTVQVACRITDGESPQVSIEVVDTGIGVAPETLARLFNDFTQADSSTARRYGGSGLGLSIARKLARLMDGDIEADSEEGVGSIFTLTFRAERATAPAASDSRKASNTPPKSVLQKLEGLRILVADDNAINRQVLRLFLAELRPQIWEATNGREALDLLAQHEVDLVLLDLNMPVMDGLETIRRLRQDEGGVARLPVFALTANAIEGDQERLLAAGMSAYIPKPLDRGALLTRIAHMILGYVPTLDSALKAG